MAAHRSDAEVIGYGMSGDAHHITAPSEDGKGAERSMRAALNNAGLQPDAIDYINAHGTSTMADVIELAAVERLLGKAAGKSKNEIFIDKLKRELEAIDEPIRKNILTVGRRSLIYLRDEEFKEKELLQNWLKEYMEIHVQCMVKNHFKFCYQGIYNLFNKI